MTPPSPDPGLDRESLPVAIEDALIAASRWDLWRTFARGLAHGLANAAQMLALDPAPPLARAEALERIGIALARLSQLNRAGESGPTLVPELLADVQSLQRLQAGFRSTELAITIDGALPPVSMPAADLAHVLMLLVTRARIAAGESQAHVRLQARAVPDGVAIEIEDDGPPLSAADRERAFEPGVAGTNAGEGAGALAAARMLARRHGGELSLRAPARFSLRAPAWRRTD